MVPADAPELQHPATPKQASAETHCYTGSVDYAPASSQPGSLLFDPSAPGRERSITAAGSPHATTPHRKPPRELTQSAPPAGVAARGWRLVHLLSTVVNQIIHDHLQAGHALRQATTTTRL